MIISKINKPDRWWLSWVINHNKITIFMIFTIFVSFQLEFQTMILSSRSCEILNLIRLLSQWCVVPLKYKDRNPLKKQWSRQNKLIICLSESKCLFHRNAFNILVFLFCLKKTPFVVVSWWEKHSKCGNQTNKYLLCYCLVNRKETNSRLRHYSL